MIIIVDYGIGNLGSVHNMFRRIDVPAKISGDAQEIASASKLLLPGVGAFDAAMKRINESGLRPTIERKALEEKVPVLGICLGMQLLTHGSEEGELPGLGWIDALVKRFPAGSGLKVPHMGWNIACTINECALTRNFEEEKRFYFVHSYYVEAADQTHSMFKTKYGIEFDSGICDGNIYGVQFHPEKSHKFGMQLFKNFASL